VSVRINESSKIIWLSCIGYKAAGEAAKTTFIFKLALKSKAI
jgi:hypothetical protein